MANMVLGTLTFEKNPKLIDDVLVPVCKYASVDTWEGAAFFSFGTQWAGKEISLDWEAMPSEQFDDIVDLMTADEAITFNPQLASGKTYTVRVIGVRGKYHMTQTSEETHRTDVTVKLFVQAQSA